MLELKPNCEHCGRPLPQDTPEAMIWSYECTFCTSCATDIFAGRCPNCKGVLEKRPARIIREKEA